jgi:hypothetical protein
MKNSAYWSIVKGANIKNITPSANSMARVPGLGDLRS